MIKYLLDTNICIYIMNKRPLEVMQKFSRFSVGEIAVSSITVSELYYGVSKSRRPSVNHERVMAFLMPFEVLSYDEKAAIVYGDIRFRLERMGKTIGPLDMFIAAHALSNDLILVTNNEKEFRRIKGLQVENWI